LVTTRQHLREELEDNQQQLSHTLESFTEENQDEYLKKICGGRKWGGGEF
jgi:hypothetical protein